MQQDRNVNSASIILCSLRQAGHTPQPATNTTNRKTRGQRISFSLGLKFCKHSPGPHRHRQQGGPVWPRQMSPQNIQKVATDRYLIGF